jgi:hypothetical protein
LGRADRVHGKATRACQPGTRPVSI